jgi:cupin 2 domain-containing protein
MERAGDGNLFATIPSDLPAERMDVLVERGGFRLERIVSLGHVTPPGEWYDQDRDEWVVLLSGAARLAFEGEVEERELGPGDWLRIPAHARHRVEWTDPRAPSVWLALHFDA